MLKRLLTVVKWLCLPITVPGVMIATMVHYTSMFVMIFLVQSIPQGFHDFMNKNFN